MEVKFLRRGDVARLSDSEVGGRPSRVHQVLPVGVAPYSSPLGIVAHMVVDSADDEYDGSSRVSRIALRPRLALTTHPIGSPEFVCGVRPRLFDLTRAEFVFSRPASLGRRRATGTRSSDGINPISQGSRLSLETRMISDENASGMRFLALESL